MEEQRSTSRAPRFVLLGAAGYIAPRHLAAIRDVGGELLAASDPHDSVGILDRYFFDARFFKEFERLDRHVEKLRRSGKGVDYVSICSPNYLHDAHVRFALRAGAHAICEKPLVINPWNVQPLIELAEDSGKKIYPVLQLREHDSIVALRERVKQSGRRDYQVDLTYITSRGAWYLSSWKGDDERSGGVIANIGVHFIDMLIWVFGEPLKNIVHQRTDTTVFGELTLERATVRWFLSVDRAHLPKSAAAKQQTTYRSIEIDGEQLDFSEGFTELHTRVYRKILADKSWGPSDALPAILAVRGVRDAEPTGEPLNLPFESQGEA